MNEYRPPYSDVHVIALARSRGLLSLGESLLDGIRRFGDTIASLDAGMNRSCDDSFASVLSEALMRGRIAPSSQLLAAAGRSSNVAACTVLPTPGTDDDSRTRRLVAEIEVASRLGMGCGADLSEFEDPADALARINAEVWSLQHRLIAEKRRPPALMISCSASHPRIVEFLRAKWDADMSTWVANISVRFSGDDLEWARLRDEVAASAYRNGEPGVLFQGPADADNPTPALALTSTAPCAEVFLAPGGRCVFLSVNIAAHVRQGAFDWNGFERSVEIAVRAGDAAVELASAGADAVVAAHRRIGVGVCGLHSGLIMLGVPYAHCDSFARALAERLTFTAHRESARLAIRRGPFSLFPGSRWEDPMWLSRKAPHRSGAVPAAEWAALHSRIQVTGIRNASVVAYPPTGVIAELLGVSRSYEPHFSLVGRTGVASTRDLHITPEVATAISAAGCVDRVPEIHDASSGYQLPDAGKDHLLSCARQLPPEVHLQIHEAFAGLSDESGSKTVNLPREASAADVASLFDRARAKGLKGITVFRDGCLDEIERRRAV